MSKSPGCRNEFVEEKRKLLYWFTQWRDQDFVFDNRSFDIKEMSMLLQILGFRLEKNLEKIILNNEPCPTGTDNALKIELVCPKSNLRSVLIKETHSCKCPSDDALSEGEFWSISGSGASRRGSINSSNSSLLPTITSAKSHIIRGLLSRVFTVLDEVESKETEEELETSMHTGLARHRSLDTLKSSEANVSIQRGLKRRPSWEVDPKTSPPTQTSSPVPHLCQSLSQISLSSDKSNLILKNLETIKKMVDETLDIASGNNLTYTKGNIPTKRVSDIKPTTNTALNTSQNRPSTPRITLTPKKKLLSMERAKQGIPSRIAALRNKTAVTPTATSSGVSKTPVKSSPSPNIIKRNILRSTASKIAVKSRFVKSSSSSNVSNSKENLAPGMQRPPIKR